MPTRVAGNRRGSAVRWDVFARGRTTLDALERLIGGLGTGILALVSLMLLAATALMSLVGVGLLMAPAALADRTVRRELAWVATHASFGLFLGILSTTLPVKAVQDVTFCAWWRLVPPGEASDAGLGLWTVDDGTSALAIALVAPVWIALTMIFSPLMAWLQAWPGRRLLALDADLSVRVAQLTATRSAALDAHATELRRIERSLHDGTWWPRRSPTSPSTAGRGRRTSGCATTTTGCTSR
ncbi:sensor domain-containing protein [Nonomuraea sp. B5E05]|uniref:sensor domain-containing protein n=1 Tax=Nonomuraea sp. B5E05 TaxID=3153569 RepID=UPI00326031A8